MSQSQWRDYVTHPPPYNDVMMRNDAFEHDDPKGWGGNARYPQERQMRANTHSLPRGGHGGPPPPSQAYPMGYASYDRRSGGGFGPRAHGPGDFPPDHYFMPSQRKYAGEELRVYVDYNK